MVNLQDKQKGDNLPIPKNFKSIWIATTPTTNYSQLLQDIETDVLVIGGGITGLNTAYFLKNQGLKVVLIEAGKIVNSTSGNTTAKITSLHGLRYAFLTKTFGEEKAKIYADSNEWAVAEYERIINKENIECDFYKAPSFTYVFRQKKESFAYTTSKDYLDEIKKEVEIAKKLNLPASFVNSIPDANIKILGAVRFDNQAYFHPRKYLLKIAELINNDGSFIFENTSGMDIKEEDNFCIIKTPKAQIKAKSVVLATNFPFFDPNKTFSKLERQGSFVIAATPKSTFPEAMFIGTKSLDMSFRPHKEKDKNWVIIGARHEEKPEGKNANESFKYLASLAEKYLNIKSIDYRWGAADTMSQDKVPYIGLMPEFKKIYIATGFSAWGMTTSMVAAKLLTDLILGIKNDWEILYDPKRLERR